MAQPFSIVVGYQGSEAGGYAFARATMIARGVPGSQIHLLSVLDSSTAPAELQAAAAGLRRYIADRAKFLGGLKGQTMGVHIRLGDPAKQIVQFGIDASASLIILGGHKHDTLKHVLLGSTSESVVDDATVPVMIAVLPPRERLTQTITIEAACVECIAKRYATHGAEWWCAQHSEKHIHGSGYSYQEELPWTMHDSEVSAIGVH